MLCVRFDCSNQSDLEGIYFITHPSFLHVNKQIQIKIYGENEVQINTNYALCNVNFAWTSREKTMLSLLKPDNTALPMFQMFIFFM